MDFRHFRTCGGVCERTTFWVRQPLAVSISFLFCLIPATGGMPLMSPIGCTIVRVRLAVRQRNTH
jgi:hypothetical protein